MNKSPRFTTWITLALSIALLSLAIVYWRSQSQNDDSSNTTKKVSTADTSSSSDKNANQPVEIQSYSYDVYGGGEKEIIIEYPQILQGILSPEITLKINTEIAKSAKENFDLSVNDITETIEVETPGANALEQLGTNKSVKTEQIYFNKSTNVFSYVTYEAGYTGGAHGFHTYEGNIFDTKTGNRLEVSDFLNANFEKFRTTLLRDKISKAILKKDASCRGCENLTATDWWKTAEKITPDGYALSASGITFLFNDYNLGAYSSSGGGQELFVSKVDLKSYIKRDW